jgi:hypothetical protein
MVSKRWRLQHRFACLIFIWEMPLARAQDSQLPGHIERQSS